MDLITKNEKIVERYRLQNIASKLCYIEGKKEGMKFPQSWHRVSACRVSRYKSDEDVSILKSKEHGTSHFGGLVVCARAWVCPVCAPIMQARRAERVAQAFQWAYNKDNRTKAIDLSTEEYNRRAFEDSQFENGFITKKKRRQFMPTPDALKSDLKVAMVTFTTPHSSTDTVQSLFPRFQLAMASMKEHNRYIQFKKSIGYVGEITATEITFGLNGPHIHRHVLYFIKDANDFETETVFKDFFNRSWGNALQKVGLLDDCGTKQYSAFLKHGVDVIARAHESDYITKAGMEEAWGADAEMTKASSKQGKKFGRTPFEILADSSSSYRDAKIFVDYVKGTKGKAQLTFSVGFKKLIGLDELSDDKQDEIDASESDDPADLLASLDYSDWSLIVKTKTRGELLKVASEQGEKGIFNFIEKLKQKENTSDEDLFEKYFETLCSLYDSNPDSFLDPRNAIDNESIKSFLVDFYSHDLEELERTSEGFVDNTDYIKKEKKEIEQPSYSLTKEEEERRNTQSFKNLMKAISL